jgi:hypothetical protein
VNFTWTKLISIFEGKTSLGAPHGQGISFMRHAKIVTRHAKTVTRHAKTVRDTLKSSSGSDLLKTSLGAPHGQEFSFQVVVNEMTPKFCFSPPKTYELMPAEAKGRGREVRSCLFFGPGRSGAGRAK